MSQRTDNRHCRRSLFALLAARGGRQSQSLQHALARLAAVFGLAGCIQMLLGWALP